MKSEKVVVSAEYGAHTVEDMIFTVRGQKVILDNYLAALYGVETKILNRGLEAEHQSIPA